MATFPKKSLRSSGKIFLTSASLTNWTKTSGFIKTSVQFIWSNYFPSFVKVYSTVKVPSFSFSFSLAGIVKLVVRRWLSTSQRRAPYRTARWVLFTRLQRQAASSLHFVSTALVWWVHDLFGARTLYLHLWRDGNPHMRWNKIFLASWETDIQICIYFKKHIMPILLSLVRQNVFTACIRSYLSLLSEVYGACAFLWRECSGVVFKGVSVGKMLLCSQLVVGCR